MTTVHADGLTNQDKIVKGMTSGKYLEILNPSIADITYSDIAIGMAGTFRHGGQGEWLVNLSAHTVIGASLIRNDTRLMQLWLMHDMHEVYTGDITTPMKRALARLYGFDAVRAIEAGLDKALYNIAGIEPPTPEEQKQVKLIDSRTCAIETVVFVGIDYFYSEEFICESIGMVLPETMLFLCKIQTSQMEMGEYLDVFNGAFDDIVEKTLPELYDWEGVTQ